MNKKSTNKNKARCSKCGKWKVKESFFKGHKKSGTTSWCKKCSSDGRLERIKNSPEEHQKQLRKINLRQRYGLTPNQYRDKFLDQKGLCAICKKSETHINYKKICNLCVDHDHETGQIRDLLCNHCNKALGYLRDNSTIARIAAEYLEKWGK